MIYETMKNEVKQAMIAKDEIKKNTLRMVQDKAYLEAKEVANKTKAEIVVTDEIVISAISKEIKQLNQTIDILVQGGKTDSELYTKSVKSKEILQEYLPKQLTEDELKVEIEKLLEGVDTSNRGLVMKTVMGALKGKADGKLINKVVSDVLNR